MPVVEATGGKRRGGGGPLKQQTGNTGATVSVVTEAQPEAPGTSATTLI